ncbi:MAG: hypothetical protein KDA96_07950 [Planctomycetaceae bacterium]|nr:hypothetical protein [Planctomycetaceae bacterium]
MLHAAAATFRANSGYAIVEPAHMELAQPDIPTAFQRCVEQGAEIVIVFPYFLSPGRHWSEDIPRLVQNAAVRYPDVQWLVTAPFGLHPAMNQIIKDRIRHCLEQTFPSATNDASPIGCDVCGTEPRCSSRNSSRAP